MNTTLRKLLAALVLLSLVNSAICIDAAMAAKKASRFVTVQSAEGDDTGDLSKPSVKLKRKDVERTFVTATNFSVIPLQVTLNGLVGPENATTRTYVNAIGYEPIEQVDGSVKEEFRFKTTFPIPVRKADKGKNGPVAKKATFRIPVPFDEQEELINLYLIGERGEKFKFELPPLAARKVVEQVPPMVSEVTLPPTVDNMTAQEKELFQKFRDSLWRDPNLMIRVSKTPGVSLNPRNPSGVFLDLPNKKRLVTKLSKGNQVVVRGTEGDTIIQGSTIVGIGTPLDRQAFNNVQSGTGYITVVSKGGNPDNVDDPLVQTIAEAGSSTITVFAQGQNTDVYFSRKLDSGSWEHVLISGATGASGSTGGTGPAGAPAASALPQCNDGVDNDGDGLVDLNDTGCVSTSDNDEFNAVAQCNDGVDNDSDGQIDLADAGCTNLGDNDEFNVVPQCNDGVDNDGDGLVDFPADLGCVDANDNERKECQDSVDNDTNGVTDFVPGGGGDPGCSAYTDNSESSPACSDLKDNDGDGLIDLSDPGCSSTADNNEFNTTPSSEIINIPANGNNTSATIQLAPTIAALNVTKVLVDDNTVPFQDLTIFFNGSGTITGFQYTGSPVFAAGNGTSGSPNVTNMGLAFYKDTGNDVIVFRGLNTGLGFYTHVLNLNYLP